MTYPIERIRNFCIVAHVDHGKSTLADRILQRAGLVDPRKMRDQYLDRMDIERERGITIKAQAVRIPYRAADSQEYLLNLIDTPGHVDFSYEVSRALAACEGAVLLVDAGQGVEAQTIANLYLAVDSGLEIIPVVNKIDLPAAQPEKVKDEIVSLIGGSAEEVLAVSAKTGEGVDAVLNAIVSLVPPPRGEPGAATRALVFDSVYDPYVGVIVYCRVMDGRLARGNRIRLMATGFESEIDELGVISPEPIPVEELGPGEVGYLAASIKEVSLAKIGDTITLSDKRGSGGEVAGRAGLSREGGKAAGRAGRSRSATTPLPGYHDPLPMVFSGLYPLDSQDFPVLRDALDRLRLNDSSLVYEPETSPALGFGFRCGFLGLLHLEIVMERLEREYDIPLVATAASVRYRVLLESPQEEIVEVSNPQDLPPANRIRRIEEPMVKALLLTPADYVGPVMQLCEARRGDLLAMDYLSEERVELRYRLPLAEIVTDFFDQLKSKTRGYASLDYERDGYAAADLVKVDILLHGEPVDAFSNIVHRDKAYAYGRVIVSKLKELIPRQLFDVPVQAAIGSKIIARETIKAKRKDVLAKCYGGDVTRKRKLLERQKEGKKRMKMLGSVEVPQEAFVAALRVGSEERAR
ncbi:MAG: elongation factor 4 [Actinomycetota bacterium]|nr:elongation factor 4 [Actinomycetota bacterium]